MAVSACALQIARSCAGRRGAAHARFTNVDALAQLLRVVIFVLFRNAGSLLIGVFGFVGAAGHKHGGQHT
jgi:hypothetical protein